MPKARRNIQQRPDASQANHSTLNTKHLTLSAEGRLISYIEGQMEDFVQKISSIEHKLKTVLHSLTDANKVLVEENQNLHKERVQLLEKIEVYQTDLMKLERSEDSKEKKEIEEVKGKLKTYITEIDSCIELLKH